MLPKEGLFHPDQPSFLLRNGTILPNQGPFLASIGLVLPGEGSSVCQADCPVRIIEHAPIAFTIEDDEDAIFRRAVVPDRLGRCEK